MSAESNSAPPAVPFDELRVPATALLVGGLLLVVMGQILYGRLLPEKRAPLFLLMIIGVVAFAAASRLISRQRAPLRLENAAGLLARYLDVSSGQIVLLFLAPCFALMASLAAGEGQIALNLPISLIAWIIAITAAVAGGYRRGGRGLFENVGLHVERPEIILIAGLFLGAFLLRAVAIGSLPGTLSGDEGSAGLSAVRYLTGETNNIFTVGWFSFPSLYFAVQSLGILALGQTVAGLRIVATLAGALTIVGTYLLARGLFGRLTALLAAAFLATFHYHVHFSRIGLNNIWDGLFVVLILAALWHGWRSGRRVSFLFCGLVLGLSQYFYVTIRIVPLLLLLWSALAFLVDRERFRRRLPDLLLAAFIAFVVVLPLLLYFQRHLDEFNAPMQRVTIFDGWLETTMEREGKPAALVILDEMVSSALGFTHEPLRHWYNPGTPLLLAGAAGLFMLGLLWAITRPSLRYSLILLPLAAMVVLGGLSQDAPASQRYVIVTPFVAILVALPLARTADWLQSVWPGHRRFILVALAAMMFWLNVTDFRYYFFEVYDSYVLGGPNTEVATAVARYLQAEEPLPDVYFFGFPRMGYYSLSTIPYLVPDVTAVDQLEPLTERPNWSLKRPTAFIFLPERLGELALVQTTYPGGTQEQFNRDDGSPLFTSYEVRP